MQFKEQQNHFSVVNSITNTGCVCQSFDAGGLNANTTQYPFQVLGRPDLFGLERSGIECVIPSLVGHMIVELINQHLYPLCMELHSTSDESCST